MKIETHISLLEEILDPWKTTIGNDFDGYKNHIYRMLNFCFYLTKPNEEDRTKLIIAAAFHDIGIWSDNTIDYLPPSVKLAQTYLHEHELEHWSEEISFIIDMHHKLRAYRDERFPLVEFFRKADLVDFSLGTIKQGIPSDYVQQVKQTIPNAGFHKCLMRLSWKRFKSHPLKPAPMMKW